MVRLGIIGTGGMAAAHAGAFQQIKGVKLTACCDISRERAEEFARRFQIPAVYTNYLEMLDGERLDGVSNVTPDAQHAEISLAVIARNMAILCEKPLATTLDDARSMATAAQHAGVINMVNFSYRNSCALQKAAQVVRAGKIGRIMHVEASYLQSWLANTAWGDWRTKPGLTWRLSTQHGSAGDLGDIGCHIYDMTTLLCGDIAEIDCHLKTFDKGVPGNKLGEYTLDANDSFVSTVTFANGALGTVHSSRWATGQANSLRVRVYGDAGAIEIDLDRSYSEYRICAGKKNIAKFIWKTVECPPTPTNFVRFVRAIKTGKPDASDFANGVKIQAYLHASFLSAAQRGPVEVAE
ncbi:MAG TPA: Gfo/Idh/MocA family oxidoreductase [Armatimonadota bacterium]|jgi:predicted dehydrogenase